MSNPRILIVGASIAGPTTAYFLSRALPNSSITVIERYPHLRPGGQNIDIRTAGVTVMRKIPGMEAIVRSKILQLDGLQIVRANGRPYGTLRATGNPDQQSLLSEYEIYRGDLSQILVDYSKERASVNYVFDEQIASIQHNEKTDGPVTVEFKNGKLPPAQYDLVVACDGATSRTRALGLNCGVRDHIKPINSWAAYFTVDQDLMGEAGNFGQAHSAIGGRFIALAADPTAPGTTKATLFSVHPRSDRDATLPFQEATKAGDDALKRFVAKRYEGVGWKTNKVTELMMGSKDFYASEIVQVKVPELYKGRFALVGDAGYAAGPTGGGTSLAMAGAYVLAGEISRHPGDLPAGLHAYQERMRPLIKDMQQIPPGVPGVMAPQTAWGIWLRNHIFAFITWTKLLEVLQKYFSSAFASTDKYGLPDYEWVK